MAAITMSNPLPPSSVQRTVRRDSDSVAKVAPADGNAPEQQKPEGVSSSKLNELQQLAATAFADDDLRLSISFERSIGRFVYRGVDPETGEVVREYPSQEVLKRIAALREIAGVTIDRRL
ncbi:MAG: flagellar protein FlaG [Alphaproteobacteria bacterium]|jgi:uncharacterized FlaG/YvyC family protein|nr:flagellar protein FlaG [Alphaproteobacteria bacterium]